MNLSQLSVTVIALTLVILLSDRTAHADLVIEDQIWGFTGAVVDDAVQPFSVLIRNNGDDRYRGVLTFYEVELTQQIGLAENSEPIVIEPGGLRWVQFSPRPFGGRQYAIGTGLLSSLDVDPPRSNGHGRIRLAAEDEQGPRTPSIASFRERLFPRGVSALVALRQVVIDHTPELDSAQQQALRDWVWLGGELHLLRDGQGHYPALPGHLAALSPTEKGEGSAIVETPFGSGTIVLHPFERHEWDAASIGLSNPVANQGALTDNEVFNGLTKMTLARHPWALFYCLVIVLLAGVGPFNFWLARRVRRYGFALLTTVAIIGSFSFGFYWLGKAGQMNSRGLYEFTYARALEDGYSLNSWNHLFVTRGNRYVVRQNLSSMYSHVARFGKRREIEGGTINGPQGAVALDIPVYSSRQFTTSGVRRSRSILLEADFERRRFRIDIPAPEGGLDGTPPVWAYFYRDEQLMSLAFDGDGFWTDSGRRKRLGNNTFDANGRPSNVVTSLLIDSNGSYSSPAERQWVFNSLANAVVAKQIQRDSSPQLFVFAPAAGMFPAETGVPEVTHYALFHHVLTKNENR